MCFFLKKNDPKTIQNSWKTHGVALWKLPFSTWTWAYSIGISWSLKSEIPKTFCRLTVSKQVPLSTCSSFKMNNLRYQCIKHPRDSRSRLKGLGISKQGLVWSFRVDMSSCTFLVNQRGNGNPHPFSDWKVYYSKWWIFLREMTGGYPDHKEVKKKRQTLTFWNRCFISFWHDDCSCSSNCIIHIQQLEFQNISVEQKCPTKNHWLPHPQPFYILMKWQSSRLMIYHSRR